MKIIVVCFKNKFVYLHAMRACVELEELLYSFSTSTLDGRKRSSSSLGSFTTT
jgi:hypothetical protein